MGRPWLYDWLRISRESSAPAQLPTLQSATQPGLPVPYSMRQGSGPASSVQLLDWQTSLTSCNPL